jgi:membrane-associated phospholipid phosphatase
VSFLRAPRHAYLPEPHDLWSATLFFAFALFSLLWPHTGEVRIGGSAFPRGYLFAAAMAASGALALALGSRDFSQAPRIVRFLRCFYPQAFFAPLFMESILLSGHALGGRTHDAFFSSVDFRVFGLQPARAFSGALGQFPWWNEIMFGAYFSFYFMLVITPWIPWLRGDEAEGERESSILAGFMLVAYVFYVFFRVVGPKHYLPDLIAAGYGSLKGGFFTSLEGGILTAAVTTGAAFPSSHVAVSLMMTAFIARTERRLLPLYALDAALIALATVYIYAHWAVDAVGGMLAAAILVPLFDRLHGLLRSRAREH